jgi:Prenyltransferase and squalene oxidase repeat
VSIRLEMLRAARLAPKPLGESALLVASFLRRQQREDGGFRGRTDQSDLYYTVFGLEGLLALSPERAQSGGEVFERAAIYLDSFADGAGLDFVHLCCLARCWASVNAAGRPTARSLLTNGVPLLERLETFRSRDGGYNPVPGSRHGTAYAGFLALGACQDLHVSMPNPIGLARCLATLQTEEGAWSNEQAGATARAALGSTNATAAAATTLRNLGQPVSARVASWLLARAHPQGGFAAAPNVPMPDMLSTATALHALAGQQAPLGPLAEACLDFVDSLWTNEGGFYGHWQDDHLDCEYTFYALLALGHLSLSGPLLGPDAPRQGSNV